MHTMHTQQEVTGVQGEERVARARFLRVKVVDEAKDGRPDVDMRMPIRVVKWGMKMARTFSPELKDVDVDWDEIAAMVDDGTPGPIVHVVDEAQHKTIDVWVE